MSWLLGKVTDNPALLIWIAGIAFAFGGAVVGVPVWKYQDAQIDSVKAAYNGFVATTKAEGEAAKKLADAKAALDKHNKEIADHENAATHTADAATIKRLRDANRALGNYVPTTAACSGQPQAACFDRPLLESAIQRLVVGVQSLTDKGSDSIADQNTNKRWALTLSMTLGSPP